MKLADTVKPISFVKAHAAELIQQMGETGQPVIITQNGEAKAVLQSIHEYEATQQTLALLKMLALGKKDVEEGRTRPVSDSFASLRETIRFRRQS
jgi:prevent-host-death family protein